MKNLLFLLVLFLPLEKQDTSGQVEPNEFRKVILEQKDIQIVDVRTLKEYQSGYIENALHIDFYGEDFQKSILKLDKDKPIAVYCAVGGRSSSTAQLLRNQGFKKVYDLKGGLFAWSRKGYKIIK